MDDQATEQAPPTPYARAQQPTDSPAASLPTETLTHVLNLALQDLSPLTRQSVRMVFSSVCKHWWSVAPKTDELVVHGSKQADRLSSALLNEEFAFRQEAIRALVITVGDETSAKASDLIGDLLLSCPLLERLDLTLDKGFVGGYGTLGKGLRNSLASCDTLVELKLRGKIEMGGTTFKHILGNLPNLRKISASSLVVTSWVTFSYADPKPSSRLEQLVMPFETSRGAAMELVKQARTSLRVIRIGSIYHPSPLVEELKPCAAQLVDVQLLGGSMWPNNSPYLTQFIKSLSSVRRLAIGPFGYDAATLFDLLGDLTALESFTLSNKPWLPQQTPPLQGLTPASVVEYVTTAKQLKHLTLTKEIKRWWSDGDVREVEMANQKVGVVFKLH